MFLEVDVWRGQRNEHFLAIMRAGFWRLYLGTIAFYAAVAITISAAGQSAEGVSETAPQRRRRAHRVHEHVRAGQVAPGLCRLGLRCLYRTGSQRLEHVLDDVLRRQPLDQLRLLQAHRSLVRNGTQQLGVLVVEGALMCDAHQEAELLVTRGRPHPAGRKKRAATVTA